MGSYIRQPEERVGKAVYDTWYNQKSVVPTGLHVLWKTSFRTDRSVYNLQKRGRMAEGAAVYVLWKAAGIECTGILSGLCTGGPVV